MSRLRILAIDPGHSTGWVIANHDWKDLHIERFGQFKPTKSPTHTAIVEELEYIIREIPMLSPVLEIVVEQFDLRPGNKFLPDLTPVKVNAILDWKWDNLNYQTPAMAKTLVTDTMLKKLGYWPTGKDVGQPDANDVRDAFRHLVYYGARTLRLPGLLTRMAS